MRLDKKLQKWQDNKLITKKQAEAIRIFEKQNSVEANWLVILFCFAAFLVGLGVISLVAANWQEIPDNIKLCGALILLLINACAITELYSRNYKTAFTACICLFCLLIMAVIGLIGQVYHLRSDFDGAMLFWSFLVFPLLFAQSGLIWGWLPIFYISGTLKIERLTDLPDSYVHTLSLLGVIIAYETLVNISKISTGNVVRALRWFSGFALLFLMFSYDNNWSMLRTSINDLNMYAVVMGGIIVTIIYTYLLNLKNSRQTCMPLFLLGVAFFSSVKIVMLPTWWFCGVLTFYAYKHQRANLFNAAVLLAVFSVIQYYSDGIDLISMGVRLIFGGIVMALILWGLKKYGKQLWKGDL